jgi:hypothetical protein
MFTFITASQRLLNNPVSHAELAYLRRQAIWSNPWIRRARYTLIALATIFATLPLWITLTDDFPTYLLIPIMIAAIYLVHWMVVGRTVIVAAHTVSHEQVPGAWDNLFLTGLDGRQIVMGKWWAVVWYMWPQHVMAALLKAGLVYGMAQFFDAMNLSGCFKHVSHVFCYYSYPLYQGRLYPGDPSVRMALLGLAILVGYGLLETGLLSALGIMGSLLMRDHRHVGVAAAAIARIALVFIAIGSWQFIDRYRWRIHAHILEPFMTTQPMRFTDSVGSATLELINIGQLTLFTLADDGGAVTTDLLRPYAPSSHVLRRLISVICGLGMYAVLIALGLRFAERVIVRRGALRHVDP